MSETQWYYAMGDQEQGPISSAQLRSLAKSGKLAPDDLVWKEGMDDWSPASEVKGLFANQQEMATAAPPPPQDNRRWNDADVPAVPTSPPPASDSSPGPQPPAPAPAPNIPVQMKAAPQQPRPASDEPTASRPSAQPIRHQSLVPYVRLVGQANLLIGLLIVMTTKGCDTLGRHYVERAGAAHQIAVDRFEDEWESQRLAIDSKLQPLLEIDEPSLEEERQIERLQNNLAELNETQKQMQEELVDGRWRELKIEARDAAANNKMWGFWREGIFLFGTLLLSAGLLTVGLTTDGAERWICLATVALIVASIYFGGAAWSALSGVK